MTREELENRAAEIDGMEKDSLSTEDIEKLAEEREGIVRQLAELRMKAAKEAEKRDRIANDPNAKVITKAPENTDKKEEQRMYNASSPEYRTAFLKAAQSTKADLSDVNFTEEERAAYVAVTTDATNGTSNLVPTEIVNRIWDMIDEQHVIVNDIDMYRDTGAVLEFIKRTAITQGDAAQVGEAAANDDEINTFVKVVLAGKDFTKSVDLSYAMAKMSIPAFESWLVSEIAARLGAALAGEVITEIGTDHDTGNDVSSSAADTVAYKDVAAAMGLLANGEGQVTFYANRKTIYTYLVGMVDTTGRPIFQPNAQAGQEGTLIGAPVKTEDAIADKVIYVGYPKAVKGNMIQDIMIETDKNIKTHTITYAGYARFECALIAPKAFAKLTVQ